MTDILGRYGELLAEVDRWFTACLSRHAGQIVCHRGCSACCRGLFDITLMDALYLKQGIDRLPPDILSVVRDRSAERLAVLQADWPGFSSPWMFQNIPEDRLEQLMPEDDPTPCVLLSDSGTCLAYEWRPMTCRLNGIPQIDVSGEWFSDEWCSLNFTGGRQEIPEDIRYPFRDVFIQELLLFRELTGQLLGRQISEMDTIVPAVPFLDPELIRVRYR